MSQKTCGKRLPGKPAIGGTPDHLEIDDHELKRGAWLAASLESAIHRGLKSEENHSVSHSSGERIGLEA
jgi:hypothetical protein